METSSAPIKIEVREVSKRFGRQWVLKHFSATYESGATYGISGRNGSGKSTLLRILAGQLSPTRGQIIHNSGAKQIKADRIYPYVSWTGPYIEIMEELTVAEQLNFHFSMKPIGTGLSTDDLLDRIELRAHRNRKLSECSSGMRQRVLLATALYADTPILLLDEPTVTLDKEAVAWFKKELQQCVGERLCVIASNDPRDLNACDQVTAL